MSNNDKTTELESKVDLPFPNGNKLADAPDQTSAVDQALSKTKPIVEKLSSLKQQAAAKLNAGTNSIVESLAINGEKLYQSQTRLMDDCRVQIRKQPIVTLGAALLAGALLGLLCTAKSTAACDMKK